MSSLELHAESMSSFITVVSDVEKSWNKDQEAWGLWYRGHQKAYWPLLPRLYRELSADENIRDEDDELREDFIKRAPSLTDKKPENSWEWYFLMQHYRVPTRLLDWTEGALIALYFAVHENQGYHHACVWVLDPWWLNKKVVGVHEVVPPGSPGLSEADRKRYRPWLPDRFDLKTLRRGHPVAIFPNHIDRRIVAQRSCFTIHGNNRKCLAKQFNKKGDHLAKVLIPSHKIYSIKRELELSGINEATVFPDLEGLGRAVTRYWLSEGEPSKPHEKVYTKLGPSTIDKGGVGVFAMRKIRKGTDLFDGDSDEMLWLEEKTLPKKRTALGKLYDFAVIKDGLFGCPPNFNRLTMSWYLNHSKRPNVQCTADYDFKAIKNVEPGTELTVDYSTYNDPTALDFLKKSSKRTVGKK